MTQIPVHAPRHWWRIAASDVPELVDRDPDVDDRLHGYRHPDRDEQRWDRIANAVSRVSDSLAAEEWTIEDDPEADDEILYDYVDVDLADLELTKIELEIVRGWFSCSHPVRADPWFDLQDGRHRLWLTAAHFTPSHKALVPVHGSEIMYATELNIPELGDGSTSTASTTCCTSTGSTATTSSTSDTYEPCCRQLPDRCRGKGDR